MALPSPVPIIGRLAHRYLLPGESTLALLGVGLSGVLLVATCLACAWIAIMGPQPGRDLEDQHINMLASVMADHVAHLMENDDVAAVRRTVIRRAQQLGLVRCQVKASDGLILASLDTESIRGHADTSATISQANDNAWSSSDANLIHAAAPIVVRDREVATLTIAKPPQAGSGTPWHPLLAVGALSVVTLLALLVLYRHVRTQLRAAAIIREALMDLGRDDADIAVARLSEELGEAANAWNRLLGQIESSQHASIEQRVNSLVHGPQHGSDDLQGACDAMADGLVLLDSSNRISYANGAAAAYFGCGRESMLGLTPTVAISNAEIAQACMTALQKKSGARGIVELDQRGTETHGVLRIIARSVRKADNVAVMLIIQDITQQRVAHESHSAFLAQAAHELRTPLTNVRLHIETAIDCAESDPTMRNECLNVVNGEAMRLERIVSDMLSVAEIEAGSLMLNEDDLQLETILNQLQKDHGVQAQAKGIDLQFHLPPKLPPVTGDQDKVLLALHNLLGNAIKYTDAGGTVTVEVEASEECLTLRVIDTGFGIQDEELRRVFDKFYRADDERVRQITGSGLGLPLARELMRMHGGDITATSEFGQGSTFVLTLPIQEAQAV